MLKVLSLVICIVSTAALADENFLIGSGMYDVTGPPADVMMMGYVKFDQTSAGIHTRLRARSFIIVDPKSGNRVVISNADIIHIYEAVTQKVIEKLRAKYGDLYSEQNVLLQATHTHSGPGGFSHYRLYYLSTKGFSPQNFNAVVDGIYQSIVRAHENLAPGKIHFNEGELLNTNVNRSPDAYLLNPPEERLRYKYNNDKNMQVMRFVQNTGKEIGVLAWFPVHATSMKSDNRLISSDNKGYAEYLFEKVKGTNYFDKDTFVASFPNSNAGDASPSDGPEYIRQQEWDCKLHDNFKCTYEKGFNQYEKAKALYDSAKEEVKGEVDYRHEFVDMSQLEVSNTFSGAGVVNTCYGAIGASMLAGAKDGKGIGKEGQRCSDPNLVDRALCKIHDDCQGEKPVALATGLKNPPWSPQIMPVQILRVGQIAFASLPGEFTTMAGRRIRSTVRQALSKSGIRHVVLAGYANGYAGYVATQQEYQLQNYEGASTHFGEWTSAGYVQEFNKLAVALVEGKSVPQGPSPLDLTGEQNLITPKEHKKDTVPNGKNFGDVEIDANDSYSLGDTVSASFWGGYPNNDLLHESSYLEVQKKEWEGWKTVAYDWDPETLFRYEKQGSASKITIDWQIRMDTEPGTYRIMHRGFSKAASGWLTPYQGISRTFRVTE